MKFQLLSASTSVHIKTKTKFSSICFVADMTVFLQSSVFFPIHNTKPAFSNYIYFGKDPFWRKKTEFYSGWRAKIGRKRCINFSQLRVYMVSALWAKGAFLINSHFFFFETKTKHFIFESKMGWWWTLKACIVSRVAQFIQNYFLTGFLLLNIQLGSVYTFLSAPKRINNCAAVPIPTYR